MSILTFFFLALIIIPFTASVSFNFTNITQHNSQNFILSGDAAINTGEHGIQLTHEKIDGNRSWLAGRAAYIKPFHLWDKNSTDLASFSTSFTIVIGPYPNQSYGDGLTFFLAQDNSLVIYGASLGLPFKFFELSGLVPFVAVEFDTFCNPEKDPIEPSNGECIGRHVGINVNNITSVAFRRWYGDIKDGQEFRALIQYSSDTKVLSVSFTRFKDNNTPVWETGLNHTIDLRDVLPQSVIFGFTAATGESSEKNIVRSWSLNSSELKAVPNNGTPSNNVSPNNVSPNHVDGNGGGTKDDKKKKWLIVGPLVLVLLVFLLAILAYFLWWRKKSNGDEAGEEKGDMENEFEIGANMPRRFSYKELSEATANFAESEKLGEGGFGGVYKGFLKDIGAYVAVKRVSNTSKQGVKEFAAEVKIISQLRHRNLVQLTGWCHEKGELMVVYEFLENGSLDFHLFQGKSSLKWDIRYKIANGLASAMLYLHEELERCILHRDIKSSNVILDSSFNAKLGDFGLAKLVDHEKGAKTTMLAGTLGYMDPECAITGRATKESYIFSFGVVILEIACGQKPILSRGPEDQIRLVELVWEHYGTYTLLEAVDPNLGIDFEEEEIKQLMMVGLWCIHPDPQLRPSMRQVIKVLNFDASPPLLPLKMPVISYGPTFSAAAASSHYGSDIKTE